MNQTKQMLHHYTHLIFFLLFLLHTSVHFHGLLLVYCAYIHYLYLYHEQVSADISKIGCHLNSIFENILVIKEKIWLNQVFIPKSSFSCNLWGSDGNLKMNTCLQKYMK